VAAAGDANRAALLLTAAQAIREGVVGVHVIKLRCGLVVPRTPRLAAVHADNRSLIAGEHDDVGIVGIDPDVLVIVAAGSAAKCTPGHAAVGGLPRDRARDVNHSRVLRVNHRNRQITAANAALWT